MYYEHIVIAMHACTMVAVRAYSKNMVHACAMLKIHAWTMIIVYTSTMILRPVVARS